MGTVTGYEGVGMSLSWHPEDAGKPFDWERDAALNAELAERRDRRKGDTPADPADDPMVKLMAVTLDEVYAAIKPAKAWLDR